MGRASDSLRERGVEPSVQKRRVFPFFTLADIQVRKADEEKANGVLTGLPREADLRRRPGFRKGVLLLVLAFLFVSTVISIKVSSLSGFLRFLLLVGPLAAAQELLRRPIERLPSKAYRFLASIAILIGWLVFLFLAIMVLEYFGA